MIRNFDDLVKLDDETIEYIGTLPFPIPDEVYEKLYSKGVLKKEELVVGKTYYGTCRNANVAVWNGKTFTYRRYKFGTYYDEDINHLADENGGFDLFIPLHEI